MYCKICQVTVDNCKQQLEEMTLKNNERPSNLSRLQEDLKEGLYMDSHRVSRLKTATEFQNVRIKFIDEILVNISKRYVYFSHSCKKKNVLA